LPEPDATLEYTSDELDVTVVLVLLTDLLGASELLPPFVRVVEDDLLFPRLERL